MQIVPQYIDVEDRVAGPLTWKHIGWFFGGAGILLFAWTLLDKAAFIIVSLFVIPIVVALAFAKPNGVTLIEFLGYGFNYFFRPKLYTWQREAEQKKKNNDNQKEVKIATSSEEKKLTSDDVAAIAQTLDSRGVERNERLQQLIKQQMKKNSKK